MSLGGREGGREEGMDGGREGVNHGVGAHGMEWVHYNPSEAG